MTNLSNNTYDPIEYLPEKLSGHLSGIELTQIT